MYTDKHSVLVAQVRSCYGFGVILFILSNKQSDERKIGVFAPHGIYAAISWARRISRFFIKENAGKNTKKGTGKFHLNKGMRYFVMQTHHTAPKRNMLVFPAMAATYCLGVFNDNYFKQAAMLLAVSLGLNQLQGWATMLFALPFILFSAPGGWCADKFSKKKVIVASKVVEVAAMIVGGAGLLFVSWPCILAMVFLMGLQSTFFSPALNGAIPEIFPVEKVPKVNAILKLVTTLAILAGIAFAGISLDQKWMPLARVRELLSSVPSFGVMLVAIVAVIVSGLGLFASFAISPRPAAGGQKAFPWTGPFRSVSDIAEICRDRHFLLAILGDAWFYGLASLVVLYINTLGLTQFGFSQTKTSLLSVMLMLGVCFGSFLAAKFVSMDRWARYAGLSALGMGLGLMLASAGVFVGESVRFAWLAVMFSITGAAGGMFIIPIATLLQVRPAESEKGRVLGASSFLTFCAILGVGLLFSLVGDLGKPTFALALLGGIAVVVALYFSRLAAQLDSDENSATKPLAPFGARRFFAKIAQMILSLRYRVRVTGLESIVPAKAGEPGILFLPNHPALIDPPILMSRLFGRFAPKPLSDSEQAEKPIVRQIMRFIKPIIITDVQKTGLAGRDRVLAAMQEVVSHLKNGENILLYPAGRLNRSAMENLGANSGVEYILQQLPEVRVVLVRTSGLWGSSFSYASGKAPDLMRKAGHFLLVLLANCLFFVPKRKVRIEFVQNVHLDASLGRKQLNANLEGFYNALSPKNVSVPYYFWQGSSARVIADPPAAEAGVSGDVNEVGEATQKLIRTKIAELAGTQVAANERLATDLGLDSLTWLELTTWIEGQFGVAIPDPSVLETVDDCILAAAGMLQKTSVTLKDPSSAWFAPQPAALPFVSDDADLGIGELFLRQALAAPNKQIGADQLAGEHSYRDLLTAILFLQPTIRNIAAQRVGIMLPASVSAVIAYFAVLLAGKTPVMFNWTAGRANLAHGVEETETTHIISASLLCKKVEEMQGFSLDSLGVEWLKLDQIFAKANKLALLKARLFAYLGKRFVQHRLREDKNEAAVILFTSGSESRPKSVPLSHTNILANLSDFSKLLPFEPDQKLLGMLPPFHSLGLVGTLIMPMLLGLQTVYHPNPTEPAFLANIIGGYKVSLVIATPTFLSGILQAAKPGQLASLRTAFTGAEKCPPLLRDQLAAEVKATIYEGYGITECSPLVSLNAPRQNKPGSIGKVMPSLSYAIVDENLEKKVPQGERGQLILRGPSIFHGYLKAESDKGFCTFNGEKWYVTGDYVQEDVEGYLFFCGRKKRFVKIAGEMISLPAIEAALAQGLPPVQAEEQKNAGPFFAVTASGDDGHPELVLFTTENVTLVEANQAIRAAGLSALHSLRRVIELETMPLLGTGKTDYQSLQQKIKTEQ